MTTKTFTHYRKVDRIIINIYQVPAQSSESFSDEVNSRTGDDKTKWRQLVHNGESAVNNMDGSKKERRYGEIKKLSCAITAQAGAFKDQIVEISDTNVLANTAYTVILPSSSGASATEANNRASAAIFKAIRQEMYQISGPTFLGEVRESLKMLRRPAEALTKSMGQYMFKIDKNLKRVGRFPPSTRFTKDAFGNWQPTGKNSSRAIEVKKVLADTWLEYSFGWSPLLSDVKNAAIALARFGTDIRRSRVSAVGVHELVTTTNPYVASASPAGFYWKANWVDSHKIRVSYKCGLSAKMTAPDGSTERLQELCGFQMQNFVPTVWELLPWSFLVDYFVNVNQVLEAYTTDIARVTWTSKCEYKASLRTIEGVSLDSAVMNQNFGKGKWTPIYANGGRFQSEVSTVHRTSGLTYPTLTFKLPDTPRQVGNMAALWLAQGRMRTNAFL